MSRTAFVRVHGRCDAKHTRKRTLDRRYDHEGGVYRDRFAQIYPVPSRYNSGVLQCVSAFLSAAHRAAQIENGRTNEARTQASRVALKIHEIRCYAVANTVPSICRFVRLPREYCSFVEMQRVNEKGKTTRRIKPPLRNIVRETER